MHFINIYVFFQWFFLKLFQKRENRLKKVSKKYSINSLLYLLYNNLEVKIIVCRFINNINGNNLDSNFN